MLALCRSIALGLVIASLGACDADDDPEPSDDDALAQGISPASLTWVLDWEPLAGMETVNDLGYRVRVEAGWIGSWGVTLVECASTDAAELAARGGSPRAASLGLSAEGGVAETCSTSSTAALRLLALDENPGARRHDDFHHGLLGASTELGVASPWLIAEGHSSGEDDPSAWVFAGVESLIDPAVVESEPIELASARYCQAHYLLAPISDASQGLAEAQAGLSLIDPELSLVGASVVILATWEPPGGGEATPFVLRSEQGYGKILELEITEALRELDDAEIEVVIRRELAGMFDGIDFASAEPDDASWQLLGNLAKQARSEARLAQ
jgi:hypothetical protein